MVWAPLAVGVIPSYFIGSLLSTVLSRHDMTVLIALFGIVAAVLATCGRAWLRICLVKRPTFVCGGCGYDLRGRGVPGAPCSECGSELRRTEVSAFRTSPLGRWILIPGVLLVLVAAVCAVYSGLSFYVWYTYDC